MVLIDFLILPMHSYTGNPDLDREGNKGHRLSIIVGASVGAAVLLLAAVILFLLCRERKRQSQTGLKLNTPEICELLENIYF